MKLLRSRNRVLPLDADDSNRLLPWTIAVMTFLAVLSLAVAMAMGSAAARWKNAMSADITVQVLPRAALDIDAGASKSAAKTKPAGGKEKAKGTGEDSDQARLDKTLQILRATPGVVSAEALDTSEVANLLKPWIGTGVSAESLPLPRVIDVVVDPGAHVDPDALASTLKDQVPGTTVDAPAEWLQQLSSLLHSAEIVALLVVVLTVSAAALTIVFTTRSEMAVHRSIIELLHLIGADDTYIARQFQAHALKLGLVGAIGGLVLAVAALLFLGVMASKIDAPLLPKLTLSPLQWAVLGMAPIAVAFIARATARRTVMRQLADMV